MIKKAKHYFNTSGPNLPQEHYTLKREKLIEKGIDHEAFYPYTNGESGQFLRHIDLRTLVALGENGKSRRLNLDIIIDHYKNYVKRRSFLIF